MTQNYEKLEKLDDLLKKGIITEDEFFHEKEKILNGSQRDISDNNLFGLRENTYCFLIHISVLLGFFYIVLGIVIPIILWVINRERYQNVDLHGKNVLNWIISVSIYLIVAFFLCLLIGVVSISTFTSSFSLHTPFSMLSGFFPIVLLMILNIVFVIIGAIKANMGIVWRYPLALRILK
ncbi:MAG: DUF4870 domain-containing protein [Prolixibacteraceae bacterium]|nr:DUF4870 domain-containing protein [Prolixibacteraceae bacterium]